MKYLSVITEPHKVFSTAKEPLLVTCDDLKYYVCKHNLGSSNSLFNEYLSSCFLKLWEIPTPKVVFIKPDNDYLLDFAVNNGLQPRWFKKTCFGSFYIQHAKEIDDNIEKISKEQLKKIKSIELLKIALFDIWIANEDRTNNHTNLILNQEEDKWIINAIDHDNVFNSNSNRDLVQINQDDTIMAHNLFRVLFKKKGIVNQNIIDDLFNNFKIFVDLCVNNLENILEKVPRDWEIDLVNKRNFLLSNLFNQEWINETEKSFKKFYLFYIR